MVGTDYRMVGTRPKQAGPSSAYTRETRRLDQVYLNIISQMVTSFPQILVGSSTWPDSRAKLAARRNVFTATLVRGVVKVMVGGES